ncbi:hypothetical protein MA16_Dca001925 [Dendrobium catenatum]|uniref:Uncharacterized protein n=1 Tax=Dendrobium catenatum TaxID=906689 RepID=A0A2I0XDX4_9ASPA|nr:hypothetical protein MA16_Dca001925 [Dendrobium catenatum]
MRGGDRQELGEQVGPRMRVVAGRVGLGVVCGFWKPVGYRQDVRIRVHVPEFARKVRPQIHGLVQGARARSSAAGVPCMQMSRTWRLAECVYTSVLGSNEGDHAVVGACCVVAHGLPIHTG